MFFKWIHLMTVILIALIGLFIRIPPLIIHLILLIEFFTSNLTKLGLDLFKTFIENFKIKKITLPK